MCGIFGLVLKNKLREKRKEIVRDLFVSSMSRGSEASGIAVRLNGKINTLKFPDSPKKFLKEDLLREVLSAPTLPGEDFVCLGHTRMVTNGSRHDHFNNQPVYKDGVVIVHNGIVCNYLELWSKIHKAPISELDSEVIPVYIAQQLNDGHSLEEAVKFFYNDIEGDASLGMIFEKNNKMLFSTNTGSVYYSSTTDGSFAFASEKGFLQDLQKKCSDFGEVTQLRPKEQVKIVEFNQKNEAVFVDKGIRKTRQQISALKRCTKCVLPESFPGISFDEKGVCNICNNYVIQKAEGNDKLRELCDKHRKTDGSPDCLLAFSGGRDSSYALHYLKQELGMNPVTLTYDWGLVTDLARRNISRMCGKLNVENILVSADITKKRKFVKLNLDAWLKKPELGMVTLLMAGDKEFFYHPQRVSKELDLGLTFFASNNYEKSNFKSAFCGVKESNSWYNQVSIFQKSKMLRYFFLRYLENPSYINQSLFDTMKSFYYAYVMKLDFKLFFDYLSWDESVIDKTLKEHYDWEVEEAGGSTWRIGDGTSAFYNYIYIRLAGFTEHDTFRSNQIRHGIITREEAMAKITSDNTIRYDAMKFYADAIGFHLPTVINRIESMAAFE